MSLAAPGCSGNGYATRFFREFFPTVESCFWIVSAGRGHRWRQMFAAVQPELAQRTKSFL
ncbi:MULTISPECIES: hypothetical protein [Mesorhizobium]|uniref:Uncharacterized protein n=1 Tax=Mesorhizobium abyssinicae TaxID=1209958 RepID=A0ABU5AWR3_9HYPH|nr:MULTISPECIES: hypothetical protein [Mesorhizobium]MDX8433478.1 hypothetical protein [Mesorhizobium abyssinicae]MDX8541752.1 hypothetical protein [Mesorhizobium abyssinicae]RUW23787.1 hypothetical protein EOA34_17145 [Mesorhizobium sp. M4B.F.Ca.ET.013.02.1.1]RVD19046.1 hypothetical protein EN738_26520 [Mesorhizobium sp. M4B.F.Ca.ET.017.02.2.1]TGQ04283.1 hypothetical protein EN858_32605 [Mesorhizobium sp. M4B.F.Ca.ET.215.01.1.1]